MLLTVAGVAAIVWAQTAPGAPERDLAIRPAPAVRPLVHDPVASVLLEAAKLRLEGLGDRASAIPRLQTIVRDHPHTHEAEHARALLQGEPS